MLRGLGSSGAPDSLTLSSAPTAVRSCPPIVPHAYIPRPRLEEREASRPHTGVASERGRSHASLGNQHHTTACVTADLLPTRTLGGWVLHRRPPSGWSTCHNDQVLATRANWCFAKPKRPFSGNEVLSVDQRNNSAAAKPPRSSVPIRNASPSATSISTASNPQTLYIQPLLIGRMPSPATRRCGPHGPRRCRRERPPSSANRSRRPRSHSLNRRSPRVG